MVLLGILNRRCERSVVIFSYCEKRAAHRGVCFDDDILLGVYDCYPVLVLTQVTWSYFLGVYLIPYVDSGAT